MNKNITSVSHDFMSCFYLLIVYIIPYVTTALTDHINQFGVTKRLILRFENTSSNHITFLLKLPYGKSAQTQFPKLGKTWKNKFLQKSFVFHTYYNGDRIIS